MGPEERRRVVAFVTIPTYNNIIMFNGKLEPVHKPAAVFTRIIQLFKSRLFIYTRNKMFCIFFFFQAKTNEFVTKKCFCRAVYSKIIFLSF